jgi:hypothetical protein
VAESTTVVENAATSRGADSVVAAGRCRADSARSGGGHSAETAGKGGGGMGSRGDGGGRTVRHEVKKKNLKYRVNCVACREREVRAPVRNF